MPQDMLDPFQSLKDQWPALTFAAVALGWFAKYVAMPLTKRHIEFIDALDKRDLESIGRSVETMMQINTLTEHVGKNTLQLSALKEMLLQQRCRADMLAEAVKNEQT